MACAHPTQGRTCRQSGKPRKCGHRICDQHACKHTCAPPPPKSALERERDAMRLFSFALNLPDPCTVRQ